MGPVIIDVVLLGILILFILIGARRGLILSITGLLALVIAIAGAYYLARTFSPAVSAWVQPRIQIALQERYTKAASDEAGAAAGADSGSISSSAGGGTGGSVAEGTSTAPSGDTQIALLLKKLGLYDSVAKYISGAVNERVNSAGETVSTALAATLSNTVGFWGLFIICFLLLLLLITILSRALNLVARLPGLNFVNRLGGALFGLIQGLLFLFLLAWATRFLGSVLPEETVSKTYFLRTLIEMNPISLWPKL